MNLTEMQAKAMSLTLNYDTREEQHSDNFSNAGVEEMVEAFGWSEQQAGGVISSIVQAGLGYIDSDEVDLLWLTDEGVNAIFDHFEAHGDPLKN
jgi:hypothetical protein